MLYVQKIKFFVVLLLMFVLGCNADAETTQPFSSPVPASDSVFISPTSPLKLPTVPSIDLLSLEPKQGFGSVFAQLISFDESGENKIPYVADLYLARIIAASEPGYAPLIAFSEDTDPKATQDPATGEFFFLNVEPGNYALVIWTPIADTIVEDVETGEFLLVEVVANQVSNLGEILLP